MCLTAVVRAICRSYLSLKNASERDGRREKLQIRGNHLFVASKKSWIGLSAVDSGSWPNLRNGTHSHVAQMCIGFTVAQYVMYVQNVEHFHFIYQHANIYLFHLPLHLPFCQFLSF